MTRAQIKQKINQKNTQLRSKKSQLTQYTNLQSKVNQVIRLLNDSLKQLNSAKDYLRSGYNKKTTSSVKLNNSNIEDITAIKKHLELRVALEIKSQIRSLNTSINSLNKEINRLWREYYKAES